MRLRTEPATGSGWCRRADSSCVVLWDGHLPVDAFDAEGRAVCKKLAVSRLKVDFAVRVPTAGLVPSCRHVHDTAPACCRRPRYAQVFCAPRTHGGGLNERMRVSIKCTKINRRTLPERSEYADRLGGTAARGGRAVPGGWRSLARVDGARDRRSHAVGAVAVETLLHVVAGVPVPGGACSSRALEHLRRHRARCACQSRMQAVVAGGQWRSAYSRTPPALPPARPPTRRHR